jgi:hypothetical protein
MWEWFFEIFSFHNIAGKIMLTLLFSACTRIISWIYHGPLEGKKQEAAFWLTVPALFFLMISFGVSLTQATGPYTKEPQLKGKIEQIITSSLSPPSSEVSIILIVTIRNIDMPSIVEG